MNILVDSSVWIDYFRSGKMTKSLDYLIDENLICVNDLILAELVPSLLLKNQKKVVTLLHSVERVPLNIDWPDIVHLQYKCLKSGVNGIGVSDLIIAQNAILNNCAVYSLDHHFGHISKISNLKLV